MSRTAADLPHIRVVAAEIEQNGEYLITQRRPEAALPLMWEFPGGRVQDGESDSDALRRAIRHRLDVGLQVGHRVLHVTHTYESYALDMVVYRTFQRRNRKADIGVQLFNATRHFNPRDAYTVAGSTNFGTFTNSVGTIVRGFMLIKW